MNNINKIQNDEPQLELLFTQRKLYSSAKRLFSWRTGVAVLLAIGGPYLASLNSGISVYVAIVAVAYLFVDNLALQKMEYAKKKTAAKVQEMFDTKVLEIPWNSVVAGKSVDKEVIAEVLSEEKERDYRALMLADWYAPEVAGVSLDVGRFICQRSNVRWDSSLRSKYLNFLYTASAVVLLALITAGTMLNLTLGVFVVGVLLPMIPLMELLIKQINEHHGSDCCSVDLKENINETLARVVKREKIKNPESLARTYQDEIYRHRSKCPMIFDWMYWIFKDRQEEQMRFSVEKTVSEIVAASQ